MAARPRRRSKKKSQATRRRSAVLLSVVLLLVGLVAIVGWLRTPPGRMALADRGIPGSEVWAQAHLQRVLLATLSHLGVDPDSILVQPRQGDATSVRLESATALVDLNLAVTGAVEEAGGRILRGQLHPSEDGDWLELQLGTGGGMTHRLVARRGRIAEPPPPLPRGRVALVLDDLGHNFNFLTRRALALPGVVTYAVLPERARSRRILTELDRLDRPALLHMPMEPEPGAPVDPGEPAVMVGLTAAQVRQAVERGLDGLPGVVGLNNHMGSRATRSRPEMDAVMEVLAERGLVFLDSQTTPHSVAHVAASAAGVPNLRNDLFLDVDTEDPAEMRRRLNRLVEKARKRGWAVGIGHVHDVTISVLEEFLPTLEGGDVELVPLSELIQDLAG